MEWGERHPHSGMICHECRPIVGTVLLSAQTIVNILKIQSGVSLVPAVYQEELSWPEEWNGFGGRILRSPLFSPPGSEEMRSPQEINKDCV